MTTTFPTSRHMPLDEQQVGRRLQSDPLLLPLIGTTAYEQQHFPLVTEIAQHITRQVQQRVPVHLVPPFCYNDQTSDCSSQVDRLSTYLIEQLTQGVRQLLLIPWDAKQLTGILIEAATRALYTVTQEQIRRTTIAAPHIHVDGVSVRRAFEGFASVQSQLDPLVEQFPGWAREYSCFSAGDVQIVLLRSSEQTKQQSQRNALEISTVKALTTALCPDHAPIMPGRDYYQWQRDGHIYANYLISRLCAVVESLHIPLSRNCSTFPD